ncbi:hypothetical protein ABT294_06180 [Nonomuraea sp. NPDC000554]|uniref:hypothetical protein n=1 Tax=Nonomuraea sp. NPDC000554 TaxID=3154259 RepID=UPI00332FDA9A
MHNWGKFYSSNHKAYTFGSTYASHGKVYTKWHGKESTPRLGYVWFKYYSNGGWHTFSRKWDGTHSESWSGRGITKVYTYTCWGSASTFCGKVYRIY